MSTEAETASDVTDSCVNCGEPVSGCPTTWARDCWIRRVNKLQGRLDALEALGGLEQEAVTAAEPSVCVALLEQWFTGALHVARGELPLCYRIRQENLGLLLRLARQAVTPVPIAALYCPVCRTRHIDEGEFGNKVHHTHACQGFVEDNGKRRRCGHVWRPAKVATVGVEALEGYINEEIPQR